MTRLLALLAALCLTAGLARAQAPDNDASADSAKALYELAFQQTTVTQVHPGFRASYIGPHSLREAPEGATSLTATFFFSAQLRKWLRVYIHPELAGGAGLSRALGVAGFMNGETFRVGDPKPQFYLARGYLQATTAWGEDGNLHLEVGKFSLADFFDLNAASHDPRSRFLNWALMSNGAWDYPANTRGYTGGVVAGFSKGHWALQGGISLVPVEANGADLDWNLAYNRGHVLELARSWGTGTPRSGAVRLLGFYNRADMGRYSQATALPAADTPRIELTRRNGRGKWGFGVSADQRVGSLVFFGRAGYNDGRNETWAFTEIDQTLSLGVVQEMGRYRRPNDVLGLAAAVNGISPDHRRYLERGGQGFMLGDGRLTYGPECALELFYLVRIKEHFYFTGDYQLIVNPGYNQDRGPVHVFALRVHTEF